MPKTDRILESLPLTFRAGIDRSALRSFVGAFGGELQDAENSLAAVMRSHWVDFADAGADSIVDLASIGALYGLLPRDDESVEEYREHLKRYVRTFLEGTVTVQGLLRIAAENLHLHLEDDAEQFDAWWDRDDDVIETTLPSGADAARHVLGFPAIDVRGADPGPAVAVGDVDLRPGVDLRGRNMLWLALDGGGSIPIDLADGLDPSLVDVDAIVDNINAELGIPLATADEGLLRLVTPSVDVGARIEVVDGPDDAAHAVLGLPPRSYAGADATRATVTGDADLSNPTDLTDHRYLRLDVDGNHLAEVDVAANAADVAAVTVDQVATAIDTQLGIAITSHDGRFLTLTSPTPGAAGYIGLLDAAAQDARAALFGSPASFTFGADARAALAPGTVDVGQGVDLTEAANLRLAVDGLPAVTVDVAGADRAATLPGEIVTALNAGLGDTVAEHDGRFVTLRSPTVGAGGSLTIDDVDDDAAERVLGTPTRVFTGTPTVTAAVTGTADLTSGVDLSSRHLLVVGVDGGPPAVVDLHRFAADVADVSLDELAAAIDDVLGTEVATDDGAHLILVSPTEGAGGSVVIEPFATTVRRRFLSRALVTDDAGTAVFGFTERRAVGSEATAARLTGVNDLLAGLDLRPGGSLRIALDGDDAVEVECAGPRPRATTPAEIVSAIDAALGRDIAFTDGNRITLLSPTTGTDSSIVLEPTRARDALAGLGIEPGEARGSDARGVSFASVVDLAAGIDLPAGAAIALGVDGSPPVDIGVGDVQPAHRSLSQLVTLINAALVAQVAAHDGERLHLASSLRGAASSIEIATPTAGIDVTAELFGVGPRTYRGVDARPATIGGTTDLTIDPLPEPHYFLNLAIDGGDVQTVDLAADAVEPNPPQPAQIASAINAATEAVASIVAGRLRIVSPTAGSASRLRLEHADVGDARHAIFGDVEMSTTGDDARPAELVGEADLLTPVDLSADGVIRIAVDGATPVDVDVAGGAPEATVLAEIIAAIDDAMAGVADATDDDRLRLTSPTSGPESSVDLLALRAIEVQEYPPEPDDATYAVAHGERFTIDNRGAAATSAEFVIETERGVVNPKVAALDRRASVRVAAAIGPGERVSLVADGAGVAATVHGPSGSRPAAIEPADASADVLRLERGRNRFGFLECDDSRFDAASFDEDTFAGGVCHEIGVFDASAFSDAVDGTHTIFAPSELTLPPSTVTARWTEHRAGALIVNLPERLDERYGVRFDEGRLGSADAERFDGVVTEPLDDDDHVLKVVNAGSGLVSASLATRVPIGWAAVEMPFRDPAPLSLGTPERPARLYLSEAGLDGHFIELEARHPGTWANRVTVSARVAGPAIYDLEIRYPGGRFENARTVVAGTPITDSATSPGQVGVLTAKAGGVHATITRDRVRAVEP